MDCQANGQFRVIALALTLMSFFLTTRSLAGDQHEITNVPIFSTISGTIWKFDAPDGGVSNMTELFCDDGRWTRFGGRIPLYGTYTVDKETVCVMRDDGQAEMLCREVIHDGENWRVKTVTGSGVPPMSTIHIKPETKCF